MAPPEPRDPYAPTYGEPTRFEAILEIDRVAGSKRLQAVSLLCDDDTTVIVTYRPDPQYFSYCGRRVIVEGRPYHNSPLVQSVSGEHFQVTAIELAPGEVPAAATSLAPPPPLTGRPDAVRLRRRWVAATGTLGPFATGDDPWGECTLTLDDGTVAAVEVAERTWSTWRARQGDRVTITAQLGIDRDGRLRLTLPNQLG
jgi:hypothetical protein